jgi:hypothetical protein
VNEETLAEGLVHYRANCLPCHGAPGLPQPAIGQGLNPPAPNLALADTRRAERMGSCSITSHGLRDGHARLRANARAGGRVKMVASLAPSEVEDGERERPGLLRVTMKSRQRTLPQAREVLSDGAAS